MKAKDYLRRLRTLDLMIRQKLSELEGLKVLAHSGAAAMDYTKERFSGGIAKPDAGFVNVINRINELQGDINNKIRDFVNEKHKIINEIQGLDDPLYVEVLFKRYVEYKSFDSIAHDMSLSEDYIFRIHGKALFTFGKIVQ